MMIMTQKHIIIGITFRMIVIDFTAIEW